MIREREDYLLRRIAPTAEYQDLLAFPRYFEVETVNACNAKCPMCTINDWDRSAGLMSDELFAKIAVEIGAHPEVERVALYRDGEPLIDKKLGDRIAALKTLGVRKVGISTNVSLLNEKRGSEILKAGIDEVLLSIDSLKPDVYEELRAGLDFHEVMHNARQFIELRNRLNPSTHIWVRMVRQMQNKDEWPEYERFWRALLKPSDRLDFKNVHNWGGQLVNFNPITKGETENPCIALWSLMVIFANGDVPMCNVDYNNKFPLGNVRDSSIAYLWRSQIQQARREEHLTGARSGICKNCTVWSDESMERMAA